MPLFLSKRFFYHPRLSTEKALQSWHMWPDSSWNRPANNWCNKSHYWAYFSPASRAIQIGQRMQIEQRGGLAHSLKLLPIDICCLSGTRMQGASSTIRPLPSSNLNTRSHLRLSGHLASAATDQADVKTALSRRVEATMSDLIPVNSQLCAVRSEAPLGEWTLGPYTRSVCHFHLFLDSLQSRYSQG